MKEENEEIKILVDNFTKFIQPRFKELENLLMSGDKKPNFIKMMKIAKEFTNKLKIEYREEFDRDLDEDLKKVNDHLGIDIKNIDVNMLNMFKK